MGLISCSDKRGGKTMLTIVVYPMMKQQESLRQFALVKNQATNDLEDTNIVANSFNENDPSKINLIFNSFISD